MELVRSRRGNWVIAPANTKSRTEPKICKSPTLTGVCAADSVVRCCFRVISLPLPQALWRFCPDGQWQLCKKKTTSDSDAHCAQVCEWCNMKQSYHSYVSTAAVPVFVLHIVFDLLLIIQLHLQVAQLLLQCC